MDAKTLPADFVIAYLDRSSVGESVPKAVPIAAIVAIVQAAAKAIQDRDFNRWKSDVTGKLDEISQKLDEIIRDIQALKGMIDEVPGRTATLLFRTEIDSRRRRIEEVIAGVSDEGVTDEQRSRLIALADGLSTPLGQLQDWTQFGFEPYSAVLSGALTMLLAYAFANAHPGEVGQFATNVIRRYLEPATDPKNPKSLETSRNSVALQAMTRQAELDSILGKWWQVNLTLQHQGNHDIDLPDRIIAIHALPTGSVRDGFQIQSRNVNFQTTWYQVLPRHFDIGDGFGASGPSVRWDLEKNRAASIVDAVSRESSLRDHINEIDATKKILQALA